MLRRSGAEGVGGCWGTFCMTKREQTSSHQFEERSGNDAMSCESAGVVAVLDDVVIIHRRHHRQSSRPP